MPYVDREEYYALAKFLSDTYPEYRELAIKIQFSSEQWRKTLFEEFAKKTITYMEIVNSYETVETVMSFVMCLYNNME